MERLEPEGLLLIALKIITKRADAKFCKMKEKDYFGRPKYISVVTKTRLEFNDAVAVRQNPIIP